MSYDDELFDHQVSARTVGQLLTALEGVPDDLPMRIITAEEPGSDLAGNEQVMISAGPWADVDVGPTDSAADVRSKLASRELPPGHFKISAEFPAGQYYRRTGR